MEHKSQLLKNSNLSLASLCVCVLQNDDEKGKKKEQHFCVHLCIYDQILTKAINIWREKEEVS